MVQMVKNLRPMRETWFWPLCWEESLEKEMATHCSILTWRTPRTEKPDGLQSVGVTKSYILHLNSPYYINRVDQTVQTLQTHCPYQYQSLQFIGQHSHNEVSNMRNIDHRILKSNDFNLHFSSVTYFPSWGLRTPLNNWVPHSSR